jgi:hypothetical protein
MTNFASGVQAFDTGSEAGDGKVDGVWTCG